MRLGLYGVAAVADQRPDESRSVWMAESEPPRPCPGLAGALRCDVAIVGGGFTGVSTALELARRHPGLGIALCEAGVLGQGASGRNGGQVLNWINGAEPATPEEAWRIHAATRQGIDLAEALAARHAPPGTFRRAGALEVYTDPRRAEAAHARAEMLAAAGIPVRFVPAAELGVRGARGALLDPLAGRLNGFALLQALRPALLAAGVRVHERTRVLRVRAGAEIALATPGGEVRSRALVLATNAGTPALGFFRRGILPLHSHVLATRPLSDEEWAASGFGPADGFTDDLDRIAYACRTPGGRLLLGGGSNAAYAYRYGGRPGPAPGPARAARALAATLRGYFPALAEVQVEHRWAGTLALTSR
jgi:glycine/D-amino acid oxidase-like deaminating enzyme